MSRFTESVVPLVLIVSVLQAQRVGPSAVGSPRPVVDLKPGSYKYQAKITMGDQAVSANISTTIQEGDQVWTATDTAQSPMGEGTDTAVLAKGTLVEQRRDVKRDSVSIHLRFTGNKAVGTIGGNGQDRVVSVDLGGPLFADAAGAPESIACLPLAAGYSTTFRNFDVQKQQVKLIQLKVAGLETVAVPAGTFDSFRVELASADDGSVRETLWIAKDSRAPVKISAVLSDMNGATMTEELLP
jgi:hypothetical protein